MSDFEQSIISIADLLAIPQLATFFLKMKEKNLIRGVLSK